MTGDKTAVENGIAEMVRPRLTTGLVGAGSPIPQREPSLSALMDEIEKRHRELGEQIAAAKKILSLIVGGLK
jgi:hypothetical protein